MKLPSSKDSDSDSDSDFDGTFYEKPDITSGTHRSSAKTKAQSFFSKCFKKRSKRQTASQPHALPRRPGLAPSRKLPPRAPPEEFIRTLQRYRGGPNTERTDFMERNSTLRKKGLVVSIEQVSIFLTEDNTIISFFEQSAADVELPILSRLQTTDTVLRRSCDASLIVQAIIDAIIDLAIPVVTAYEDAIADLELDVLTDPSLEHSKSLYVNPPAHSYQRVIRGFLHERFSLYVILSWQLICTSLTPCSYIITSELSLLRSTFQPIIGLLNSLRDHKDTPLGSYFTRPRQLYGA